MLEQVVKDIFDHLPKYSEETGLQFFMNASICWCIFLMMTYIGAHLVLRNNKIWVNTSMPDQKFYIACSNALVHAILGVIFTYVNLIVLCEDGNYFTSDRCSEIPSNTTYFLNLFSGAYFISDSVMLLMTKDFSKITI